MLPEAGIEGGTVMSLTSFVRLPKVAACLKTLLPPSDCRKVPATLKVEPRTDHYTLVGTAFDYLLRFEVQRRAPHAHTGKWVAENAVEYLERYSSMIQVTPREMTPAGGDVYDLGVGAYRVVEDAKSAVGAYVRKKSPRSSERAELARHALRLARLDPLFRAGVLDLRFEEADAEDAEDLLAMLSIVPFETLIHDRMMLLNATFGESSRLVGGADADLITGNTLVDIKTVKRAVVTPGYFYELLGYLILSRNERRASRRFPEVNCLGVYFSRHGHLWTFDVKSMVRMKSFRKVEEWCLKEARRLRRLRRDLLKKPRRARRVRSE